MLWKSNKNANIDMGKGIKGRLKQNLEDISAYLCEKSISRKAVTMAAALLALAGLVGVKYSDSGIFTASSSAVNGRELPIYCVQTDEPKIALTFDAAWGNGNLRRIYSADA